MTRITGNTFPVKEQLKALGGRWNSSDRCWEVPDDRAEAARALVGPTPLLNSPPPQDLGTADPVELAARFGRTAVPAATVRSFTGFTKQPTPNGTVTHFARRGERWVQVAHSRTRYYSREMLEDFDMFDCDPGYQYQWDGVQVEPTAAEQAQDAEVVRKRAEAERIAADELAQDKLAQDQRWATWEAARTGLEECTSPPVGVRDLGPNLLIKDVKNVRIIAYQIFLADGRVGWRKEVAAGDDWRTYYYLPADVAVEARLAHAARLGITPERARDWLTKYAGCHGEDLYQTIVDHASKDA